MEEWRTTPDGVVRVKEPCNEIVYFGIPKQNEIIYLNAVYPKTQQYDYPIRNILGEKAPMYCTGIGKSVLAFLPDNEAKRIIFSPKINFTINTIVNEKCLQDEIDKIRSCGYALDNEEHEYGIKCVGVPVFANNGSPVAGISISGSAVAMSKINLNIYAEVLQKAAYEIRNRL